MLAAFNGVAQKLSGGFVVPAPSASIEVRREDTGALAAIFSDEAGTTPITNPSAFADANGNFRFYAEGLERGYQVTVTDGAVTRTLRNVGVGTAGQGDLDAFAPSVLLVAGTLAFTSDITPAQITANQNDYNPTGLSTASVLRLSSDAHGRVLTGLQGGSDGRLLTLHNVGSFVISLANEDTGSSAGNRFKFDSSVDLGADQCVAIQYDSTSSRWRLFAARAPVPKGNAIINGDLIVWQRGTSFASIASGAYSADRWLYQKSGAMVHDVSRSTDVPTVAQAGRLFNYSILIDCTTADATMAAGDYLLFEQKIEGFNWLPLAQRDCMLHFWVKATKTGTYCVAFENAGNDRTFVAEYTVNVADTWEKKSISLPASPSAGTWDYANSVGLRVIWCLAVGSTRQTTAGAWQTGDFAGTANQVNACDDTANNFRLTGVEFKAAGVVATAFDYRTFNQELQLCQRYFSKSFNYVTAPVQNAGVNTGALNYQMTRAGATTQNSPAFRHPVAPMRVAPTIVFFNPAAANAFARDLDGAADATATTAGNSDTMGFRIVSTSGGGGLVGSTYEVHYTASAEL